MARGRKGRSGRSNSRGGAPEHVPVRPSEGRDDGSTNSGSDRGRGRRGQKTNSKSGSNKHLIYGVHACLAVLANPERSVRAMYITRQTFERNEKAIETGLNAQSTSPATFEVMPKDLDELVGSDQVHQGIALDASPLPELDLEDLPVYRDTDAPALLMILDQVTDPHNVGAILRSAAVFGADAVIMHERHSPPMTPVLLKTSCGGAEAIPLIRVPNIARAIEHLDEQEFVSVGLAAEGEQELSHFADSKRICLVMGAEGSGIRRLVRDKCTFLARLPSPGPLDHLNVSNAAAVALYECVRSTPNNGT